MSLEEIQSSSDADDQESKPVESIAKEQNASTNSNIPQVDYSQNSNLNKQQEEGKNVLRNEDQDFYEEILQKLDIKPKKAEEKTSDVMNKDKTQNSQNPKIKQEIEKALSQDFAKIQKLVQSGLINSGQGQNLKKQVLKKAFDKIVQTEKVKRTKGTSLQNGKKNIETVNTNGFEDFSRNNPDFFNSNGRKEVLNYLKSGGANLGGDELGKISEIVRTVEKSAIERFLQKVAHEKSLKSSNESAKQRLTANAQNYTRGGGLSRAFTREQIGKMSGAEFTKYESAIMEALKKGQIR